MSRFRELPSPVELEEEVLAFWKEEDIPKRCLAHSAGRPSFVFYEGPPTANGMPHNGHVLTRVIKDLFPRYKTMRGYHVERKAGWDTHGLPVEIEVEKELGMRGGPGAKKHANAREAIQAYGLDNFSRKCVESVFTYTHEWEQLTEQVGFWIDMEDPYVTYHRSYVESVWWALAELHNRGLLYQGHKVLWWWAEGGTALSAGEVGEGYRDVDDPSVTIRFPVKGQPGVSLLAWTTTPWTLPSNVALAVGPDLDYAKVQLDGEVVIAAAALAPEGEVLEVMKGRDLVGLAYEPPFHWAEPSEGKRHVVVAGAHVSLEAGTGIVHTAPAYGEEDFELAKLEGLAMLQLVGPDGRFGADAPEGVCGLHFKAADKPIMRLLKERDLLFAATTVRHSYPFCPRSKDDPLIQLARPGWFIKTTAFKDDLLKNNAGVAWLPEHIQEGRFGNFLRNNVDWALSRERWWGTPLPIWTCGECSERKAFASVEDLKTAGAVGFAEDVDPNLQVHKPWVDRVTIPCGCGGTMNRVSEVIDCWFDSGCMPFAQFGFPHKGVEEFKAAFPADFISEAVDQTRGWFYSLMMISTMLFDEETCQRFGLGEVALPRPYKNCLVLGHVCDMDGKKESKSVGNYTSPSLVLRGRMKMKVVADPSLERGQCGMVKAAVRSIALGKKECMRLTLGLDSEASLDVSLIGGPSRGKETVALHPEDMAELGIEELCWLHAPFQAPGADAFRWLFYAANPPWTNTRLSLRAIREGQREFHLRLANVFQFFTIYANINGFVPDADATPSGHVLDRWIVAESDAMIRSVTQWMDSHRIYEAARAISDFVDGLSNWYIRRSRSRFWGDGPESTAALQTLHGVLETVSRVTAPFVPFMAEAMAQRLGGLNGPSVHMEAWPQVTAEATEADAHLAEDMALIREIASLGLSARARVGVKVRQPLAATEVILADHGRAARLAPLTFLLTDELNVREVRFTAEADTFVTFQVKPNYPVLGKRLGKEMKACAAQLAQAEGAVVRQALLSGGYPLELPSGTVSLTDAEVVVAVQPREGYQAAGSADAVVVLHAELDQDLRQEGLSREVLSRIQSRRKELDLGYTDRIHTVVQGSADLIAAVERFSQHLQEESLSSSLEVEIKDQSDSMVDGHAFELTVTRA